MKPGTLLYEAHVSRCTDSVVWSPSGALKFSRFLSAQKNVSLPIDHFINRFIESPARPSVWWIAPTIVQQGSQINLYPSTLSFIFSYYMLLYLWQ